ncbi:MAG: arsenite methyltransferase [Acidimicrobiia bacterium]|nr:arsenite methyltransferase [Acidimicrobiia bacterium]
MTIPDDTVRTAVRDHYAAIAITETPCCSPKSVAGGYDPADLASLPDEAVMGLGCGNPVAMADITEGETVLDLGSGGGIDVFLAARKTGRAGRVIGVDMTAEMLERAEKNAANAGLDNVEFRRGLIEDLPVEDATVDVILSNCVINLAPDKAAVFAEAFRVLRPGGRIVVSDIVRSGPGPEAIDPASWSSCIDGALPLDDYLAAITAAGFESAEVLSRDGEGPMFSVTVRAFKASGGEDDDQSPGRACSCGC